MATDGASREPDLPCAPEDAAGAPAEPAVSRTRGPRALAGGRGVPGGMGLAVLGAGGLLSGCSPPGGSFLRVKGCHGVREAGSSRSPRGHPGTRLGSLSVSPGPRRLQPRFRSRLLGLPRLPPAPRCRLRGVFQANLTPLLFALSRRAWLWTPVFGCPEPPGGSQGRGTGEVGPLLAGVGMHAHYACARACTCVCMHVCMCMCVCLCLECTRLLGERRRWCSRCLYAII